MARGWSSRRTISVDENYMFTVRDAVQQTGSAPVKLLPYGLISRTGTPQVAGYYILHEGLIGDLGGSLREVEATARSIRRSRSTTPRPAAGSALPTNTG